VLVEHVENGGATRDWIKRREGSMLQEHMSRGADPNSTTFMKSAFKAYQAKLISEEVAIEATGNESEFKRAMRGVA